MPCLKRLGVQKGDVKKESCNTQREKQYQRAVPANVSTESYIDVYLLLLLRCYGFHSGQLDIFWSGLHDDWMVLS